YRWLAPWRLLREGKIVVWPALRPFRGGGWRKVAHRPLRDLPGERANREQIEELLGPYRQDLAGHPLYVSLDTDVLTSEEAIVNWDSGHLASAEVLDALDAFASASAGLAGADVVGDWSPVRVRGLLRRALHATEHPRLSVAGEDAQARNEALNLALLEA